MKSKRWIQWFGWILLSTILFSSCSSTTSVPTTDIRLLTAEATSINTPTKTPIKATLTSTGTSTSEPPTPSPTPKGSLDCSAPTPVSAVAWKFVFVSHGKLWIKERDAEAQVLTDMGDITGASISPDGSLVIFSLLNSSLDTELWSINSDGSGLNQLTGNGFLKGDVFFGRRSFSPDGNFFVFIYSPDEENVIGELWTAHLDGSSVKKLVGAENLASYFKFEVEPSGYIGYMSWVPDTNKIIFYVYTPSTGLLLDPLSWVDVETEEFGEFLPKGTGGWIDFSPDHSKFTIATKSNISLLETDSQELLAKITFPDLEYLPRSWFPDPRWVQDSSRFLVALPPKNVDQFQDYTLPAPVTIWSIRADGTDPIEITETTAGIFTIAFSPDLEKIAYATGDMYTLDQIEILDQSGSILKKLTCADDGFGMSELWFEQWSPDSRHFAYLVGDSGCACGYTIIADVCSNELVKVQDEPYWSGYVPGFITWLDSNYYLYYDYPSADSDIPNLVLNKLGGEYLFWTLDPILEGEYVVVDYSTP